jgi:hypothetical protein
VESKEQKYNYRYEFKASGPSTTSSQKEPDKNELLAYINEVLGIDKPKKESLQLTV